MKGFLTGIGVGTAIGFLLAPDSGRETRKKIMTSAAERLADLEQKLAGKTEELDDESILAEIESGTGPEMQSGVAEGDTTTPDAVAEVLNSASKTQLKKVPGIGDATARRIIDNRPYESEAEVVESKVMPDAVLKKLKDKLVDAEEDIA